MKPSSFFILATALLTGCLSEEALRRDSAEVAETVRVAPEQQVVRNITNFSPALRCMDRTLMMYGIRDLVVISEDIEDKTKKVSAGTKDMLISAVSGMSRSSRAIRLIAYGNDSVNLISFMKEAENKNIFQLRPQFGIRGSISQFDENIAKKTEGGGLAWEPFGSIGKASSASISILGLDLTMMRTEDLTIIPGVTSNNTVAIMRSGSGTEAEAGYSKFGINYQMNLSRSEGMSQALRNLVDLAAIELFGKLTKTPYWACLGGTADAPEVKAEIDDWYHSLFADANDFVAYWQNQLRLRGLYPSEINGVPDEALRDAVQAYREALGLPKNAKLDLAFFTAYLKADHYEVAPRARERLTAAAPLSPPPAASPAAPPLRLDIQAEAGKTRFQPGERIVLTVTPSRDAYVYCFIENEERAILRFFPNRFVKDAFVSPRGMSLPRDNEFTIHASPRGGRETIACFASEDDVFTELPAAIAAGDFEALAVGSLAEVSAAFQGLRGVSAEFPIQFR
jgi:curli biogenesis system outer membrane secretion channel CsgG